MVRVGHIREQDLVYPMWGTVELLLDVLGSLQVTSFHIKLCKCEKKVFYVKDAFRLTVLL